MTTMLLRTPDPFPTLAGRHHYPFDPGTAFSVVYDAENSVELLDVDRRTGVTLVSAEMIVSDAGGGASILTRAATIVDDGATTGVGTMHFDFTGPECAGWTVPKAIRVNVTDSFGRVTMNFDGGWLVPVGYMVPATPDVDHIQIAPTEALLNAGEKLRFAGAAYDSDDLALNDRIITFTSDNPLVASVDADGVVTAYGEGRCLITASSAGVEAAATVEVRATTELTYLDTFFGADLYAVYSTEFASSVAESSGVVDGIADARGGGYGPTLASTGTARPAWDAVAKTITFDGVDDYLTTGLSALFDLSGPKSLVVVGTFLTSAGDATVAAISESSLIARLMAAAQQAAAGTIFAHWQSGNEVDSTVATGSDRRLVIVAKDGSATGTLDVPTASRQTRGIVPGATASGNNALTVSGWWPGSGPCAFVLKALLVLNRQATTPADVDALAGWATTYHGAVLA